VKALVDGLCRLSSEFESMWRDNDVCTRGEGTKYVRHPIVGLIALEYSAFAVDGQPDLGTDHSKPAISAILSLNKAARSEISNSPMPLSASSRRKRTT